MLWLKWGARVRTSLSVMATRESGPTQPRPRHKQGSLSPRMTPGCSLYSLPFEPNTFTAHHMVRAINTALITFRRSQEREDESHLPFECMCLIREKRSSMPKRLVHVYSLLTVYSFLPSLVTSP